MKKLLLGSIFLAMAVGFSVPTMAEVGVGISVSLPPAIVFAAPPEVIVIPETNVYAVPDLDVDVYFYQGWWWRPWQGRWYRSHNYDSGWRHYRQAPSFFVSIPSGWRSEYRAHRWKGHEWRYQRIRPQDVRSNWRTWERDKHWERHDSWGVKGLQPQKRSSPRSGDIRPQQAQPQTRKAVQRSKSQQGKDEKEKDKKHD